MAANQLVQSDERNAKEQAVWETYQPRIVHRSPEQERKLLEKRDQLRDRGRTFLFLGGFYLVYSSLAGGFAYYEFFYGAGGHPLMTSYAMLAGAAGSILFLGGLLLGRYRLLR